MPRRPELVRVRLESGAEVSLGVSFARSHNLEILDQSAKDGRGVLPPVFPVDLKGEALDAALEAAGLPKSGTADEKRQRLAEHQASGGTVPTGGTTTTGGATAPSE